ncbi:CLUMA_CG000150, isoform A [Clunio marinus]|uniref:CLUMA_CG000150, isoform A n=1 Tax=Clunio marinus TaxID=568069 RepID=A0A1J1HG06_9DIPT|nr:CLUMA_CG000150, isoform A [Clunio marinus]
MSRSGKRESRESDTEKKERKRHRHHRSRSSKSNKTNSIVKNMFWGLLMNFFYIIRLLIDKLVDTVLEWYLGNKKVCPALQKDFFITKSAVEIAEMIRTQELKSYQVVNAYINRIIETNPVINAIIDGPFMDALDEATKVDERIGKGLISEEEFSEKPFLGVPFTTKDSTAVEGKLFTWGIIARKNLKAKEDAECVRLMKEAGAIIIATTSIPEINRWQETRNNLIGQTNNPYDSRRTVGGSSGGEGAVISSCGTAFGLGTDIGGSIRMPAYYCGIFGHKPTTGLVNTRGCTGRTGLEKDTMVVAGPMTRYAVDLKPIFEVLIGPKNSNILKLNVKVDVKKLRYFYCMDNGDMKCSQICSEVKQSMDKVVQHFYSITGEVVNFVKLKGAEASSKLWRYWMTQEPGNFNQMLGNSKEVNPIIELIKKLAGQSDYTLAAIYSLIDSILPAEKAEKMRKITKELDEEIQELLGDDGILLYPSSTYVAPFHYAAFIQVYNFHYWSLFNVLHLPATQVPLGLNSRGIPLGIQVVATRNRDRDCLAVAEELEREFGGWVAPFIINNKN